jgi:hypothetical protein
MGLFGKSKHEKICEHMANQVLSAYKHIKTLTEKDNDTKEQSIAFDMLYQTARTVISNLYEKASPSERQTALDECAKKFRQHLNAGATIGLVDVCAISHGCSIGLQESYTATLNRYIQILYKMDVLRFDIQGSVYEKELERFL